MADAPKQAETPRYPDTTVVLLFPEVFASPPDAAALRNSLEQRDRRVRLLIRLAAPDLGLAETLARDGVAVEVLAPDGVAPPPTALPVAFMPPGSSQSDTDELALALCDVLLVPSEEEDRPRDGGGRVVIDHARQLNKKFLRPGAPLPELAGAARSIANGLDPEQPGWRRSLRWFWGRSEQFLLELAAFNWRGFRDSGAARSRARLRACLLGSGWSHTPYFAPEEEQGSWRDLACDEAALDRECPIVATFDRLDRSALHGAFIHRDLAWAVHAAAAFAVLFAVLGYIELFESRPWLFPAGEFVALAFILAATVIIRRINLQDRWTACRFGAEQLRIARMCLPLLVVQNTLCTKDEPESADHSKTALAEVKRAVRDQGLPRVARPWSPSDAARWLAFLVGDQCAYHRNNHHKLHCADQRLIALTMLLFLLAFLAVCLYPITGHNRYLLILTAALPAFAAAIHGVTTRLGLVHRIQLSQDAEAELSRICEQLRSVIECPPMAGAAWAAVRGLAFRAAEAMGRETTSWHSQVRRQKDELT